MQCEYSTRGYRDKRCEGVAAWQVLTHADNVLCLCEDHTQHALWDWGILKDRTELGEVMILSEVDAVGG